MASKFFAENYYSFRAVDRVFIGAYHPAESLIYANLDPGFPGGVRFDDRLLSKDPGLFMPLLSTAIEWLNVLPVHEPVATVRPRIPVNPQLLATTSDLRAASLSSS